MRRYCDVPAEDVLALRRTVARQMMDGTKCVEKP